jgi:hypothetical protein
MTTTAKPLTDTEMLSFVASINYACLFVTTNGQRFQFGPGELAWHRDLRHATPEQRQALSERIVRQQGRTA